MEDFDLQVSAVVNHSAAICHRKFHQKVSLPLIQAPVDRGLEEGKLFGELLGHMFSFVIEVLAVVNDVLKILVGVNSLAIYENVVGLVVLV